MLEVRSGDNGLWVGNKNNRVWIASYLLDAKAQLTPTTDREEGELVYTQKDPLFVGHTYAQSTIVNCATNKLVVVDDLGTAYQYLVGNWSSATSCFALDQLPAGNYTVVWMQE